MLNIFHLRYTAIVLESRDWWSPSIQQMEAAWRSHSLNFM